jgi:hypothetical protein
MKNFIKRLHAHRDGVLLVVVFIAGLVAAQINDDQAATLPAQVAICK